MTHSPHPWRYNAVTESIDDADGMHVASLQFSTDPGRDEANGELIAMVPCVRDEFRALHAKCQELQATLGMCVKAIDELLPGMAKIPCDVGLINEALIKARPLTNREGN